MVGEGAAHAMGAGVVGTHGVLLPTQEAPRSRPVNLWPRQLSWDSIVGPLLTLPREPAQPGRDTWSPLCPGAPVRARY